jgi:peptidoglycan/xylan/chitin deacetylase (PgdA/CDA1 family)
MALRSDPGQVNGHRRIWPSSPFLKGLLTLHVLLALACVLWPAHWLAWVVSFFTMHVLVGVLVLQPRNPFFGPNITRLSSASRQRNEVAITFDDGPDALVTPRILDLLDRFGAKASFFVIGNKVQNHPDLARDIVRRGHSLENHSSHHFVLLSLFAAGSLRREVQAAQCAIAAVCGQAPRFFRPPGGFHSPLLSPVLAGLGLRLATWTRRGFDTRDDDPRRVLNRLTRDLSAGDILVLHDGNAVRAASGAPVVLEVLHQLLHELQARGLHCVTLPQASPLPSPANTELGR